jgi:hypothetical protein
MALHGLLSMAGGKKERNERKGKKKKPSMYST